MLQKGAIEVALVAEAEAFNRVENAAIGPGEHFLRALQASDEMVADGRRAIRPREQPDEMGFRERNQVCQLLDTDSTMQVGFHELVHNPLLGSGKSSVAASTPHSFNVEFQQATRENPSGSDHKFAVMAGRPVGAQGLENARQVPGERIVPGDQSQILDMDSMEIALCTIKTPKETWPHIESDHPRLLLPAEPVFHLWGDDAKLSPF